ncbi:MAG: dUTP diphosphatase [Candidatus Moeniiplasma glomeromycotorum]|nr:dUTP diphosphatase [Candidatus Moeniiplasma glomeromycotorum]MCE8166035.1 dUTP diphosphatase [Candidatus Moeniiplasma glomeromycotorum]
MSNKNSTNLLFRKNITDIKSENSFIRTKVALLVEIGELANELATFKHWKSQKEVDWEKAREELIDCFHFYLSFTNNFQIDFSNYSKFSERFSEKKDNIMPYDLSPPSIIRLNKLLWELFFETERMIPLLYIPEKEYFYRWLIVFEELCQRLGMENEAEIKKVYLAKNKKNREKQKDISY